MNAKDIESTVKNYPSKIKADNVAISALQKSVANLPKVSQNSIKENLNFGQVLSKFDSTQECNPNFTSIYQQMRQATGLINDLETEKANIQKELSADIALFVKENTEQIKDVTDRGQQNTGIGLMNNDMRRIIRHKKVFQQLIYSEMKTHAKMFEIYCKLFEDVSTKVNVLQEFQAIMIAGQKFPADQLQDYIQYKLKSGMASDFGNQFRGGIQQPRSQSQQRTPMRGMQSSGANGGDLSQQSSAQRGRSEAPPELGRR